MSFIVVPAFQINTQNSIYTNCSNLIFFFVETTSDSLRSSLGISCRVISSSLVFTVYTTPVSNSKSPNEIGTGRDFVIDNVFNNSSTTANDDNDANDTNGGNSGNDMNGGNGMNYEDNSNADTNLHLSSSADGNIDATQNNRARKRQRRRGATNNTNSFTTICFNHIHKQLWRSRLTVHINGVLRETKRFVYPPASNMSPIIGTL